MAVAVRKRHKKNKVGIVPPVPIHRFTVEEYQRMAEVGILSEDAPVELLEGWIVPMPIRKPSHDGTLSLVDEEIQPILPLGWFRRIQSSINTEDSYPQPDFAVVRGPRAQYVKRHPGPKDIAMLIEVADASLLQDSILKARIYARANIPIYWIINLVNRRVEVYTEPTGPTDEPTYRQRRNYGVKAKVPVVIDGQECGRIEVRKLFPA
jgi:Uma2 family endonuclease